MKKKAKQYSDYVKDAIPDPIERQEALRKAKSNANITMNHNVALGKGKYS